MEKAIVTFFLILIFVYLFNKVNKKKSALSKTKLLSKHEPIIIRRGKKDCYDINFYTDENSNFKIPKMNFKGLHVKITDDTSYKDDIFYDFKRSELSIELLENEITDVNRLCLEIEYFDDFIERLQKKNMTPYEYLEGFLLEIIHEIRDFEFPPNNVKKELYMMPNNGFNLLFDKKLVNQYVFTNQSDKDKYILAYLHSLSVQNLKELSKKRNMKISLKKNELLDQIIQHGNFDDIPLPYLPNENTYEIIQYFITLYFNTLKTQIDNYHPIYIEAIWNEIELMYTKDLFFEKHANKYIHTFSNFKYWENRFIAI
jgi:hypothetical protein